MLSKLIEPWPIGQNHKKIMAKNNNAVFNIKKRWLRRPHISLAEVCSSLAIGAVVVFTTGWFMQQQTDYDPGERDLDPALLADRPTLTLYTPPLKIWQEPGTAVAGSSAPMIEPFPNNVLDPSWQMAGRIRRFEPDNLYEKINGEAEKFLQQNFKQLHYLVLKSTKDGSEIAIELFDHGDVTSSIGIFSGHAAADTQIVTEGPVSYFETGAGMIGRKDAFFFRVAASNFNDDAKTKVRTLVNNFSALEGAAEDLPAAFLLLTEQLKIAPENVSFAANDVFQFDFAQDFWFAQLDNDDTGRAFVHQGTNVKALFDQLLMEFDFDYELLETLPSGAVTMKHRFLNTYLAMHYRGEFLFGAENVTDVELLAPLMETLASGIPDNGPITTAALSNNELASDGLNEGLANNASGYEEYNYEQ